MSDEKPLKHFECRVRSRQSPQDMEIIRVDATDTEDALARMHRDGHLVISVHEKRSMQASAKKAFSKEQFKKNKLRIAVFSTVSTRELIFFAVQLSTLLKSGIALIRGLDILQKGTSNAYFADVIKRMSRMVSEGHTLAEACRKYPKVFPGLWPSLIEVGELSGTLHEVIKQIADYQDASEKIKGKVVSALFYPAVLLTVAMGCVIFLMVVVIPKFEEIFKSANVVLPIPTQIVIFISILLRHYTLYVIGGIIGLILLIKYYARTPLGKVAMGRFFLKLPVFGYLFLQVIIVRFCRGLSTMITAGIPLLKSLDTASMLAGNAFIQKNINMTREEVSRGHGLGVQLEMRKIFPIFVTELISIGEETGEVDAFLRMLADYYEEQVNQTLARLSTLIEPILLLIMAFIIGGIVISMFLPIVIMSTGGTL